jgi:hypothetical protein
MDEHEDLAIASRVKMLASELPVELPPIGPVKHRGRGRHRVALAGVVLAAVVLVGAVAIPLHSLLQIGKGGARAGSTRFDPLKAAPRPCPDGLSRRGGGTPAQFALRMQGHLPNWLPAGFGLLNSGGLPGHTPFGIWSDARCREIELVLVRGGAFASSPVSIHVWPVGSWLMLFGAPGGCPRGADKCFDYKAYVRNNVLLLHTKGLSRTESNRVATSVAETGAARVTTTIQIDPEDRTHFDPPPAGVMPALSAIEAAARFKSVDQAWSAPGEGTVQLGLYTSESGFSDRLAYGFRSHRCAPPPDNPLDRSPSPGSKPSCTFWLFLDANTGRMLEARWQVP